VLCLDFPRFWYWILRPSWDHMYVGYLHGGIGASQSQLLGATGHHLGRILWLSFGNSSLRYFVFFFESRIKAIAVFVVRFMSLLVLWMVLLALLVSGSLKLVCSVDFGSIMPWSSAPLLK
jgi:hypothetical protein